MFLTLKIFTKQKRRIGKVSVIFRFQCSLFAIPFVLPHKMISKIQLIGNKEVTLLVKLNR